MKTSTSIQWRIISLLLCLYSLHTQAGTNILTNSFSEEFLNQHILSKDSFKPFPPYADTAWDKVPESMKTAYISEGEKLLHKDWEVIPAILFTEFRKNGNRVKYEAYSFERRNRLIKLVWAEMLEHKGRFMDDIVNGVWAICEETWWGASAHYGPNLPDINRQQEVDLMQAETAAVMACTNFLLKNEFDKISPLISQRISAEVHRRILDPCTTQTYWWMKAGMNWNPWICSNWIMCLLLEEKDTAKRSKTLHRIFQSLDIFIDSYADDGGCDEGPAYWGRAAASLFDCLDWLYRASAERINIFSEPKVKEMGRFVFKTYIANNYYVNFADARAYLTPDAGLIYRYGKAIQDETMIKFGSFLAHKTNFFNTVPEGRHFLDGMPRTLYIFQEANEMLSQPQAEPLERDQWLPDLQVMTARSYTNSTKGLYLAAKGGHNAEAHNHNDIGNFIIYFNGLPLIIDMGVGTYEKNTFNDQRYTIWTMQSGYHNTPTINGVTQKDGKKYCASEVEYRSTNAKAVFKLDVAKAYPANAGVESWKREISLDRGKKITISEKYKLKEYIAPSGFQLMTMRTPELQKEGTILLTIPENENCQITYDHKKCTPVIEEIELKDNLLISVWGHKVYRIVFTITSKNTTESVNYAIETIGKPR